MNRAAIMILVFVASVGPARASAEPDCKTATVLAHVNVPDGEWSLAEVLAPDTCAPLRQAASRVRLGVAPLPGSPRILTGQDIRRLLEQISASLNGRQSEFQIPERIIVEPDRRSSGPASLTSQGKRFGRSSVAGPLVKPGETAILVWQQGGILVQLPVICLDSGGLGQSVRARITNGFHILRAEVVGKAALRVSSGG